MTNKLVITEVEFSNFLSYGDYKTSLNLSDLGPVLIVGDRSEEISDGFLKSNGAGKSTITTAILWALFGRTFSLPKPGDKIVNWSIGKNCYVKLKTNDGWEIKRTRKMAGDNELSLNINGDDKTLSTPTNTEKFIHDHFGLDFDIFTSSVFFGQFSKSFLELSDQKRRAALERLLNLDKLNVWAAVAKQKLDRVETELTKVTTKIESYRSEFDRLNEQKKLIGQLQKQFEEDRKNKISQLNNESSEYKKKLRAIVLPDLDKLKSKWDAMAKIFDRLSKYNAKKILLEESIVRSEEIINGNTTSIDRINRQLESTKNYDIAALEAEHKKNDQIEQTANKIQGDIREKEKQIIQKRTELKGLLESVGEWEEKLDTVCPYCNQEITGDYARHACKPYLEKADNTKVELSNLEKELKKHRDKLSNIPVISNPITIDEALRVNSSFNMMREEKDRLTNKNSELSIAAADSKSEIESISKLVDRVDKQAKEHMPTMTMDEAREISAGRDRLKDLISSTTNKIEEITAQPNPHAKSLGLIDDQINQISETLNVSKTTRTRLHLLFNHLSYIRSAYKDRTKIKSYILSNLIPILNKRIQYYLESFDCEFAMEFTPSLSILPSKWDYHLCSGGERKRIDMAMMFALYDLYIHMHGQQCNIMVLDEVDGKLDADGIESFINIINNDFNNLEKARPKPDSILIISHRPEMLDAFPSKILVKKSQGFSFIESVI